MFWLAWQLWPSFGLKMRSGFKGFILALGFATIVPMPRLASVDQDALRRSMGFFPVAGLVLGLFLWALIWTGAQLVPRSVAALLALALYVLVTGALHLDGLADTFDALGSRKPPVKALEVMKDSRIGTMGAVAVILVLLGKALAFTRIPVNGPGPWMVVPVLARTSVVWSMKWAPAARPEGLGALYAGRLTPSTVVAATVVGVLAAATLLSWPHALLLVLLSLGMTLVWVLVVRRRFGGATGDTYGALLEVVEWVGFLSLTGGWGHGR